jgi:HAD superfamily hydrolase (TIGR01509 family)
MSQKLRAVFFDVGNTLLFPDRAKILAPLHERKMEPSPELLRALECRTKKEFDAILERGPADHGFWSLFYSHLINELGIEGDGLRDLLIETTQVSANWCVIRPGTRETLQRIGRGHQTGVISNADGKIDEVLERCGIADCFLTITDSGVVGYEKPRAEIFQAALRETGSQPEESLYVGDVYSVDYLGATRAGMRAILFDVAGAYKNNGLPRVESLEELEEILSA